MDINQFLLGLNSSLATLDFVDNVKVVQRSVTYIKVKVTL